MIFTNYKRIKRELEATGKSNAVIHFSLDGIIIDANKNFLDLMGYSAEEIIGKHHSIFVPDDFRTSAEYSNFWNDLREGKYFSKEFCRIAKNGKQIWIQGSYNPILGENGKPVMVVKYASDITSQKLENASFRSQVDAISRAQAVIEFDLDGKILYANSNFLETMGYTLDEIQGKHHSIFIHPKEIESTEYKEFWRKLNKGEFFASEYLRYGKNSKEVWIQASYNPIFDMNGKPTRVIKYATDTTEQKLKNSYFESQIKAIGKSQAVIEFSLDGIIINANKNFLDTMGYKLNEISGKHHKIFVEEKYEKSEEYHKFWENLRKGESFSGEFKRIGKNGKEVYIYGSYNPISDEKGRPFKIVKYAADVTLQVYTRLKSQSVSKDVNSNVTAVASATEEMLSSAAEISKNINNSSQSVNDIAEKIKKSNNLVGQISDNSKTMESLVELISGIANKVNLLALNATIEAVRAGESGNGFAVVAGEVKNLAKQVSDATNVIADKITTLQNLANEAVSSSDEINNSTNLIKNDISAVASAIEEQSIVTREISINMHKISSGTHELNDCINSNSKLIY